MYKTGFSLLFVVIASCCLILSGCGSNGIKAGGTVKFSDGSPLTCGTVLFENESSQYVGHIKPDGSFVVSGLKEGDGLPAGTYKVAISGAAEYVADAEGNETEKFLINPKYISTSTSDLAFDISPENKKIEITVEKP